MSTFKAKAPEKIEFTLTATMTLREWRKVKDQLVNAERKYVEHPMSTLSNEISDMIIQAERVYYPSANINGD
jgi:hypothetical protein